MDNPQSVRSLTDWQGPKRHQWRVFSLWCPSPLQHLYCWLHLSDDALELLTRRVFVVTGVAWLPVFVLSAISRRLSSGANVPFALDLDLQARLLVVLPVLIAGEVVVHRRMPVVVRQFVERRIVVGTARHTFEAAVTSALSLSGSRAVELLLILFVYSVGASLTGSITLLAGSSWYGTPIGSSVVLTPAGWWYSVISRPLFQFILLRWYFRLFVWSRFLWQLAHAHLQLMSTHPDRRGGLGFLFNLHDAFGPFLFAHGAMLAGRIGNGVIHGGMTLRDYEFELLAIPAFALSFVLAPDLIFALALWRVKRNGLVDYGRLAQRYVRAFDDKWMRHHHPVYESLLGSPDIQSLADLANSFEIVRQMQFLPTRQTLISLVVMTILPLAPLPLTVISSRELLERLVKVLL